MRNLPEWLLKTDSYTPVRDRAAFVDKSILSLLGVLSKLRRQSIQNRNAYSVNTFFKLAFTFLLIALVSISRSFWFVVTGIVYLLLLLAVIQTNRMIRILKAGFTAVAFTAILLIPSFLWLNGANAVMLALKVFVSVTAVGILSETSHWHSVTAALKLYLVPDIFIFVLDITLKYIAMLGEMALNMLHALKLRSVGGNTAGYASLSGILGTMFLKSKEAASEMYSAMECRGYTGEYRTNCRFVPNLHDAVYVAANILIIAMFIYTGR